MTKQSERARRFLELHRPGQPLLMPNPWDAGTAKLLQSLCEATVPRVTV